MVVLDEDGGNGGNVGSGLSGEPVCRAAQFLHELVENFSFMKG